MKIIFQWKTCLFVSGARARFLIAFHFLRAQRPTLMIRTIVDIFDEEDDYDVEDDDYADEVDD